MTRHFRKDENAHEEQVEGLLLFQVFQLARIHEQLVKLNVKEDTVMASIEEVQAAVAAIEGDTANVERVLGELNTQIQALTQQVADLLAQAGAATTEQLQAIADRLTAADAALDSLAPDAP